MRKVTIYCEGGTTWILNTDDEHFINGLWDWLDNPKSKDFMSINDEHNKRKIYLRKQKVNIMTVDDIQ